MVHYNDHKEFEQCTIFNVDRMSNHNTVMYHNRQSIIVILIIINLNFYLSGVFCTSLGLILASSICSLCHWQT